MRRLFQCTAALAAAALFTLPSHLSAQTSAATLRGVVRDSSQGVVPGAGVTLTNTDQNRSWNTKTNDRGEYDIEQIPPGHYALSVESTGFKKYVQPEMTLAVNQVAQIDVTLQPGSISESIEVRAEAPLLESASSSLGEVVNHLTTVSLPLNGRNIMQLVALTPGINTPPADRGAAPFASGQIASVGFSANGSRNLTSLAPRLTRRAHDSPSRATSSRRTASTPWHPRS
ncbi:MAG: carboxypeptidase-like regulatory domain-containing protein [Acidobacteria bacterium]|nr:carboxypeptidase-like regulatory domain-containing protein [Acidobacteriota bacterium]